MARSYIAGMTNYSNQTMQDMLDDLENWINSINETDNLFHSIITELDEHGYWNTVDYDFKASCYDLMRYFKTSINDLQNVIDGINSEIKEYHVKLVKNLGKNAHEQNEHHRRVWREFRHKEYGDSNFQKLEKLYGEGGDMTGDMFDLNNLASRLEDFVGMSKQPNNPKSALQVTNNFNAPVTGIQQNYDSNEIQQTVTSESNEKKDLEEIKTMIYQFRELLELSTSPEKEEIAENLSDIEETIEQKEPKKNRIKSFGNSISTGMKKMLTMKSFNNLDEVSSKLPKLIDSFSEVIEKL